MKRSFLSLLAVLSCTVLAFFTNLQTSTSQTYYIVGGGTGTTPYWGTINVYNPITDYYWTCRHVFMFRGSELLAQGVSPGQITSIGFRILQNTALFAQRSLTIKAMTSTTITALTPPMNNYSNQMTTVYSNSAWNVPIIANNSAGTWYDITFQTPILWDGTSNLIFEMCSYRNGYTGTTPTVQLTPVSPSYGAKLYHWQDGGNYCATGNGNGGYSYRPVVRFGLLAGVEQSFPDAVDPRRILRAGSVYDGSTTQFPKPSLTFRQTLGKTVTLTYKIVGPFPSTNVVYEANVGGNPTMTHVPAATALYTYPMTAATGPFAGTNGALDLTNAAGGSYRLEATFSITGYSQSWTKNFIIAFPNDVSTMLIRSPLAIPRKYPRGVNTPVSISIQNVGLNNVTNARSTAVINRNGGAEVYREVKDWAGTLATGETSTIDFPSFNTLEVGQWTLSVCTELLNAIDQQTSNDCLPQAGQTHVFQTLYNEEVGAYSIGKPTANGAYYAQRPFRPSGNIQNTGMLDLTDIPVRMEIFKLSPTRTKVYSELFIVPDCPSEVPKNFAGVEFPPFTPSEAGQYEACMTTEYPGDPVPDNNSVCQVFTVGGNLSGTYTVGLTKTGQARNYNTIQDAVDDLYLKGVSGAVTFELTDAAYSVGSTSINAPALDFTTTIIGTTSTNTITFKPSLDRSLSKGACVVTLNSGKGVGINFGQALLATNPNAVQLEFSKDSKWSNFGGYINFDGGQQKSLVFQLNATTPFRAPFYLGDGTQNVSVKNCIIRNAPGTTPSYATSLPKIVYGFNLFQYEADVRTVGSTIVTYTAGIVSRQKIPTGQSGNNAERLDTVIGLNNKYIGNEITGFGYGIASMGVGMAIKGGENVFKPYYSKGTEISNNLIYTVRGAGVFAGYEDGAKISGNRIHTIGSVATGGTGVSASGILAGGVERYHNVNLLIDANEISGVTGDLWTRGITVEQVQNTFPSVGQAGLNVKFPQVPEALTIRNNVIWGVRRTTPSAGEMGIHVLTQRDATKSGLAYVTTPAVSHEDYFTRQDRVINNTLMMQNDNVAGTMPVAGIGIQHGNGSVVKNNTIMMQGGPTSTSYGQSALFYQGVQMTDGNDPMALVSDRNAFELGAAAVARFVEITKLSVAISPGAADEFQTLAQWRAWTNRDVNSVEGELANMHQFSGIAPNQMLRVKTNPTPIGSVLNNRGESISGMTADIDGNARGASGQLIDIGADEFDGRLYIKDYEAVVVLQPSSYRSSTGPVSDAEYVMTKAPVNVIGLVRNSGGLAQTNIDVTVRISLENTTSNNFNMATPVFGGPVITKTVKVSIDAGKESAVDFMLANFTPQTYSQLAAYTIPSRFGAMAQNVTPRYKIEVTTAFDENNVNNTTSKIVRFFVSRSLQAILISGVNAAIPAGSGTASQTAGRLNKDSLEMGIQRLGLANTLGNIYYDVLDRDAWEQRAVNYSLYRTLFWSGNQDALSTYERRDLRMFTASGTNLSKKNLAVGSQEYPRKHIGLNPINDESFVNTILRVKYKAPGTPVPSTLNYSGKRVRGDAIARNSIETVQSTTVVPDAAPNPALVTTYTDATTPGLALPAYVYMLGDRTTNDSLGGAASSSLVHNVVYIGTDWRHWKWVSDKTGIDRVLRGIIDFFESNGGSVVPVELTRFDANARGTTVDVSWTTASEMNASHFNVERSDALAGNNSIFSSVGTVSALGNTTTPTDYKLADVGVVPGRYLYRLSTFDRDGSSKTSGAVEVVVGGTLELTVESVSPQPATTQATVAINVPQAMKVSVDVVNSLGQRMFTAFEGNVDANRHAIALNTNELPNGIYTIVIRSDNGSATTNLVIRR